MPKRFDPAHNFTLRLRLNLFVCNNAYKLKELHAVFEFFYCVTVECEAGDGPEIVSGRLIERDMLAATRKLEELYPMALEFQVRKYSCNSFAICE